ncbi:hypothetical protein BDB01DRAFT_776213 [Pilobolus umbonatus]|nr:hypothetical protein BDB01DRAFT_776213 [Pilobolus umbonatus]
MYFKKKSEMTDSLDRLPLKKRIQGKLLTLNNNIRLKKETFGRRHWSRWLDKRDRQASYTLHIPISIPITYINNNNSSTTTNRVYLMKPTTLQVNVILFLVFLLLIVVGLGIIEIHRALSLIGICLHSIIQLIWGIIYSSQSCIGFIKALLRAS